MRAWRAGACVSALTSCLLPNGHGGGTVLLQTRPWQPEGGSLIGPSPHDSPSAVGALLLESVVVQEREFALVTCASELSQSPVSNSNCIRHRQSLMLDCECVSPLISMSPPVVVSDTQWHIQSGHPAANVVHL